MNAATGTVRPFPWDELIGLGLGLLRLAPRDFWAMTPREISHVLRFCSGGVQVGPPARRGLEALMSLFPDDKEK